jgi:hypothetical protein
LIVGISAFILLHAKPNIGSANFRRDYPSHSTARRETIRAKRNRANRSLLSRKRFDATEDLDLNRPAYAVQSVTEVMHPKSISRERAQENEDRPGIA